MSQPTRERAQALMAKEKWQEAAAELLQITRVQPEDADSLWNPGWCYFKVQEFESAVSFLDQACALAPDRAVFHWALATALAETESVSRAEAEFHRALGLYDGYLAWAGLALLLQKQGRLSEAEAAHREAIARRPDSRERVEAYADFLFDTGREDEARSQYTAATKLWFESHKEPAS